MKNLSILFLLGFVFNSFAEDNLYEKLYQKWRLATIKSKEEVFKFVASKKELKCQYVDKSSPYVLEEASYVPEIYNFGNEDTGFTKILVWSYWKPQALRLQTTFNDVEGSSNVFNIEGKPASLFAWLFSLRTDLVLSKFSGTKKLVTEIVHEQSYGSSYYYYFYALSGNSLMIAKSIIGESISFGTSPVKYVGSGVSYDNPLYICK